MLVIVAALGRAVLCLAMALYISKPAPEGLLIYPLAFGVLVLAKGYTIAKSALVPAVVKDNAELVNANSRLALISVLGATVGGIPAAVVQHLFGADWSLRAGAVVFVVAAILAFQIPKASTRAPTTAPTTRSPRPSCTRRASCSVGARSRCSAAASASSRSSPRSRSSTISSRSASCSSPVESAISSV